MRSSARSRASSRGASGLQDHDGRGQRRNWQTSVIGTDNNYFTIDNREIVDGRTFEQGEMQSGAAVCVIGGTIQKELFGEGAEVIGRTIRTGSFSCRVVGLLKTKGTAAMGGDQDDLLVMPIKTLQRRILGKNRVGALLVSVNPQSDRDRLRDAVTELMRERRSLSDGDDDNFQILTRRRSPPRWHPPRRS